jgi:O-acetylserine/cysteine efflux transporter
MSPRHLIAALMLVAVWGTNFVALKWSLIEIPPFLLTALRYIFTAFPAILFIRRPNVSWRFMAFYALFVGVLQFSFAYTGLKLGAPAGLSSIIIQVQAFFTIFLAVWLLGERPNAMQIAGAVIAFGGIGVIALERIEPVALIPLALMVASSFWWSASNIITKKAGQIDMLGLVVWSALFVPVPMLILSLLFEGGFGLFPQVVENLTLRGGLSVMFTAYLSTLFGYGIWAFLLGKYPASTVAPFTLLVPIFGFGSAFLFLGESITIVEVAGSVLVFAGLIVNVFGPRLLARPVKAA